MKIADHKAKAGKGEANSWVDGLRRNTFDLYDSIRHNFNQTLLAVGNRLRNLIDCKALELQRIVHAAFCNTVGVVLESFAGGSEVADGSLKLVVDHARHDEPAKPESSNALSKS